MTDQLTIGSLFSGYGGLDMAAEHVFGARTAWVSDIDKGARKVLAHRYPHAPNLGDITTIDWADIEPVDIITGGSPCQDLSTAGRRAGMTEGTRSNLWVAMREAIANVQPAYVIWENVRGAFSAHAASDLEHCPGCMGDGPDQPSMRALNRVLGDLADLGLDAEWRGLRASDVGACHQRFRVFVLAWRRDAADADRAGLQGQRHPQGAAQAERHGHAEQGAGGSDLTLLPTPAASVANDGEGTETWLARRERVKLTAQNGNGMGMPLTIAVQLLPTPRATDGTKGGPNQRGSSGDLMLPSAVVQLLPTPVSDNSRGLPSEGTDFQSLPNEVVHRWGQYAAAIARHERMIGRPAPSPTEPGRNGKPRLSPEFTSWMMGLPDGWITDTPGVTRNEALKLCGNGVVPHQAAAALADMLAASQERAA